MTHDHHYRGVKVNPTERTAKTACTRTGLARVAAPLVAALAVLACSATPALAAAPEAPTLTVEEPVHATTATFHGILNPLMSFTVFSPRVINVQSKL